MLGRFNIGGAKNGSMFPIYQQLEEPTKKTGLWLKTAERIKEIFFANEDMEATREFIALGNLPFDQSIAVKDNFIYYGDNKIYRYDTINKVSTAITGELGINLNLNFKLFVNNDLYVFDNFTSSVNYGFNKIYKVNLENSTITAIYQWENLNAFWVLNIEDNIFWNGNYSTYGQKIFQLNLSSFESSEIKFPQPINYTSLTAAALNKKLYFVASLNSNGSTYLYEYDFISKTFVTKPFPYKIDCQNNNQHPLIASVGECLYFFGGKGNNVVFIFVYKYDTTTGVFTQLSSSPKPIVKGRAFTVGRNIYLINCTEDNVSYKYNTNTRQLPKGVYLYMKMKTNQEINGYTPQELYKYIYSVDVFNETEKLDVECYIGNGSAWNIRGGVTLRDKILGVVTNIWDKLKTIKNMLSLEVAVW